MNTKRCPSCEIEKPLSAFWIRRDRNAPASRCKPCSADAQRVWRRKQPDYDKLRYQAVKTETRERHLIRKYGVSLADYESMLSAQGGRCCICLCEPSSQAHGVFHVDHCHATGRVRGLLCRGCNHVLGHLKDDPSALRRAIAYLRAAPEIIGRAILEAEAALSRPEAA